VIEAIVLGEGRGGVIGSIDLTRWAHHGAIALVKVVVIGIERDRHWISLSIERTGALKCGSGA